MSSASITANDKVLQLDMGKVSIPDSIPFTPYQTTLRRNVLIHVLFDNTVTDPNGSDAAIIRYLPGAFTPRHLHTGYELVLVLDGEYVENDVLYKPGTIIVRGPGTTHEMKSATGCTLLAVRDVPVTQLT